ncbi:UDP-N-acetylmuramoyl-L-alanine--D-glutamate ligase [Candidatus Daviesbacteria bacterium]|nr:UDP-N-acetylmuramoyl-L-alanine--D-glutamate ligase [Candidatus Daviesbacteria bacterium]
MQSFKDKKILVFGLGLNQGGVGSALFFVKLGAEVKVTDLKTKEVLQPSLDQLKDFPNISYTLGEHKNEDIDWADLIIKNPAVKPGNQYIEYALKNGKQVETDMGIFLQSVLPSQIIGVTGTKGKSTTSSLIYEVLKAAGRKVVFAGNIGKSVLETIPFVDKDTLVVLEISSFQLEAFDAHKVSPKWAVITNITPDHLNYYKSMDEYIKAKKVIGKYQTEKDYMLLKKDDPVTTNPSFLEGLKGQIIYCSTEDLPQNFHPHLLGQHNLGNIAAVYNLGKLFDINPDLLLKTLTNFKGIPFRMELIKDWDGVKIYNDTTATSPESGIQAIKALRSHIGSGKLNIILVCGGMNKGMDYTEYAKEISKSVKKVFFLEGDSTDSILRSLQAEQNNLETFGPYNNLEQLLEDVKKVAKPGDTILFSPAATSFNLFQNEFDRGRKFNKAVEKVFGTSTS